MFEMDEIVKMIDEMIEEAEKEPAWTAKQALRCLKKELQEGKHGRTLYLHAGKAEGNAGEKERHGGDRLRGVYATNKIDELHAADTKNRGG